MPNMTPEELRNSVGNIVEQYAMATLEDTDRNFDKTIDQLIQLFADLCGEVIGPDESYGDAQKLSGSEARGVPHRNSYRVQMRTRLTKLTGKEIK